MSEGAGAPGGVGRAGGLGVAGRFAGVFREIASGAVARELDRELAFEAVASLRASGFTAVRVPAEYGGSGCSLSEFFAVLADLAAADSNVAHLLRGHFAFVEILLLKPDSEYRRSWLRAITDGAIVGNAASETTGNSLADISTTLVEAPGDPGESGDGAGAGAGGDGTGAGGGGRWLLNGRKFYSTGTLYSSHVYVAASRDGERVTCVVPTDARGVTMLDNWNGFGQRLTASGTTTFENVEIDPATIANYSDGGPSHLGAFFQLVLVTVAAGISAAVLADAVAYVQPRTRTYISANATAPRDDPQVKQVVGELSAIAFTGRALVQAAAASLEAATSGTGADRTALLDAAEIATYQAQVRVLDDTLRAATLLFEVGGASATATPAALDRHWRNARTVASHNPAIYKYAQIGDWELNGVGPTAMWERLWAVGPTAARPAPQA